MCSRTAASMEKPEDWGSWITDAEEEVVDGAVMVVGVCERGVAMR